MVLRSSGWAKEDKVWIMCFLASTVWKVAGGGDIYWYSIAIYVSNKRGTV